MYLNILANSLFISVKVLFVPTLNSISLFQASVQYGTNDPTTVLNAFVLISIYLLKDLTHFKLKITFNASLTDYIL